MATAYPYAGRKIRNKERQEEAVSLYRSGHTLQQIGDKYGLTRERIRQILVAAGVSWTDGGQHVLHKARTTLRRNAVMSRRNRNAISIYGCTYEQVIRCNDGQASRKKGSLADRYVTQKNSAIHTRGISWEITFPEWVQVWKESGKIDERGLWANGYCMARKGDVGPYSIDNVYITTVAANAADYQAELKIRGVVCPDGYRRLPERAEKLFGISVSR